MAKHPEVSLTRGSKINMRWISTLLGATLLIALVAPPAAGGMRRNPTMHKSVKVDGLDIFYREAEDERRTR